MAEEYLNTAQAAKYLGISVRTLWSRVHEDRKIPVYRATDRSHPKYARSDLDAYMESIKRVPVEMLPVENPFTTYRKRRKAI